MAAVAGAIAVPSAAACVEVAVAAEPDAAASAIFVAADLALSKLYIAVTVLIPSIIDSNVLIAAMKISHAFLFSPIADVRLSNEPTILSIAWNPSSILNVFSNADIPLTSIASCILFSSLVSLFILASASFHSGLPTTDVSNIA